MLHHMGPVVAHRVISLHRSTKSLPESWRTSRKPAQARANYEHIGS